MLPDSVRAVLTRLQPHLGLSDARIERLMTVQRQQPRQPQIGVAQSVIAQILTGMAESGLARERLLQGLCGRPVA